MDRTAAAGKDLRSLKNTLNTGSGTADEPKTQITTLPNGLRIASEESPHPVASIGLFINCGRIYETAVSSGAGLLLRHLAFYSTLNRSRNQLFDEAEATRGSIAIFLVHELTGYKFAAPKIHVPKMVEWLVDVVRNPAYLDGEVMEGINNLRLEKSLLVLQAFRRDLLHSVAFSGALAEPVYPSSSALSRLNSSILRNFVAENYTAPRIVLAASGVEHEELVSIATPLLLDLPMAMKEEPKSVYVGGELRQHGDADFTFVALTFETPGGMSDERMSIAVAILEKLFGGCILHSKRNLVHLDESDQVEEGCLGSNTSSYEIYNHMYNHTGLFASILNAVPHRASEVVDSAVEEFIALATPGKVHQEQLDIAKEAVKAEASKRLEDRMDVSQDIAKQILLYGERKPFSEFLRTVDSITLEDFSSAAKKIISSRLTLVALGDVTHVPSYTSLCRRFGCK